MSDYLDRMREVRVTKNVLIIFFMSIILDI